MIENRMTVNRIKSRQQNSATKRNDCLRCGTCCQKGGPALHSVDLEKVESGQILLKYLFTMRAGEPIFDNVRGMIETTDTDIIKIKAKARSSVCIFYDFTSSNCGIYDNRPLECRLLKCWDTGAIEADYNRQRLSRKDLIVGIPGLWELVMDHQERCSFTRLAKAAGAIKNGKISAHAEDEILEMIRFDDSLRTLIPSKSGMDKEILEFLLGRPIFQVIHIFGISYDTDNNRLKYISRPWASISWHWDQIENQ